MKRKRLAIAGGVVFAILVALFANARRLLNTRGAVARTTIDSPEEHTTTSDAGAVRSVQSADIVLPREQVDQLWTRHNMENLGRTYWRFLTRISLGVIRVHYRSDSRVVCLFGWPALALLTFRKPEYEFEAEHGLMRWPIEKGVLVSSRGRGRDGYLEIDVRRTAPDRLHVEVEVANFYPAIASRLGRWIYENTQSRIHVIVTHGFLRSLAKLDLAESSVGRWPAEEPTPEPVER